MRPHDDALLADDLAALAAEALPPHAAELLEAHLRGCDRCREQHDEFARSFDAAVIASVPPPGADLRARIFSAARRSRPPVPAPAGPGYAALVARDAIVPFAAGIEWAVVAQRGLTLVYWVFDAPACGSFPPETHTQTQAGFVLEGRMDMRFGDGTRQSFDAGAFYAIAPGTVHEASFVGRTVIIDTYAPNYPELERRYQDALAARYA